MHPSCALWGLQLFGSLAVAAAVTSGKASLSSVSQQQWNQLNSSVAGRLHTGLPMAAPCFTRVNGKSQIPDLGRCNEVQSHKTNTSFIVDNFGGYEYSNWASCQSTGQNCALSFRLAYDPVTPITKQCQQGSVPPYYIDVSSVQDVQAGLAFATKHNLRLTIKNTGHDYKGRSSGADSLALWTHNYQPPITLKQNFTPDQCSAPVGDVITFGAGQGFDGIYRFAHENNRHVVGGTSQTVGAAGGWIAGGGHSILSPTLGLGVDNVQQLKVVLPTGKYVTANRCQNQDIFFALRGGGGGTFGVVMEMSTLAHPVTKLQSIQSTFVSLDQNSVRRLVQILVDNADKWANEGWGGYALGGLQGSALSVFYAITPRLTLEEAKKSMQPLTDFQRSIGNIPAQVETLDSYWDYYTSPATNGLANNNNFGAALSSRLVPRQYFSGDTNKKQLVDNLYSLVTAGQQGGGMNLIPLFINIVAPSTYKVPLSDQVGGPGQASVTPAWRNSLWHVIHLRSWDATDDNPAAVNGYWRRAHAAMDPLRAQTPDGGAYQNEADAFEADAAGTFWGQANYARLLKIKKQVDPQNVLSCHQCIGWDSSDSRYGCYPSAP